MSSLEWIKTAYDILNKAGSLDMAEKLMELREELFQIREINLSLQTEINKIKEELKFKGKIIFKNGICWINDDEISQIDSPTPICPQCYQINKHINRLPVSRTHSGKPYLICKQCNKSFDIK